VAVAVFLAGCEKNASFARDATAPPPPEVSVSKPISRDITDYFEFPGQTAAVGEVEVRARVTGYLLKVCFEDGQEVKKGAFLYEIDPRPYQADLDRAEGDLARLNALLNKAKADLLRAERLRPSGAMSQDEYEQCVAQLAVHKASIQSAEAAVRDAKLDLEFTRVVSPIAGRVSRTRITEGNLIQTGSGEATVLTTVVTTNPVYVYFNIDEPALLRYDRLDWRSGRETLPDRIKVLKVPVEIGLGNEKGFPYRGTLDFLDNKVDSKTGTIRARGVFDNAKQYLTPGLFVRVRLPIGKPHRAVLVSERAVGTDQGYKFLLAVNQQNVVERRQVKLGAIREGLRVVESGVGPDDWIIVKGLQRVRPGLSVQPRPMAEGAVASSAPDRAGESAKDGPGQTAAN
jgi:RND family efflux transporter MFP subunit